MDAGDLTLFAAVAEAGGITRAAETLHTVQSNVTQRIRRLEAELGVPLFNRHSRGVTLTSAGTQLLPYAERIGRLLSEAKEAAADGPIARRLEFGTLDGIIGCAGAGIGVTLLPRIVVAKAAREGRVALHPLPPNAARIETVLIRRRDIFVSTALARFIEIAHQHLANRGP